MLPVKTLSVLKALPILRRIRLKGLNYLKDHKDCIEKSRIMSIFPSNCYSNMFNFDKLHDTNTNREDFFGSVDKELKIMQNQISQIFDEFTKLEILPLSRYYFELKGKSIRPAIVCFVAKICNNISYTPGNPGSNHSLSALLDSQIKVATFAEMVHTSSLLHDDVIDKAHIRRGQPSANNKYGQRKPILAGNFVLALASRELSRLRDPAIIIMLSKVLRDLVDGELMQMGTKDEGNQRFAHYLRKTFNKAGSLLAYSCKAVAYIANPDDSELQEAAYRFGKSLGVAFQLRDDILDFVSTSEKLGKPSGGKDLVSGLATGPLLFACDKFPFLEPLIVRRFTKPGDVDLALKAVKESDGINEAQRLVECYCKEALLSLQPFMKSSSDPTLLTSLNSLCQYIVERDC